MVFRHLIVTGVTYSYIITVIRTILNYLIVNNTKNIIIRTGRYLVIKKLYLYLEKSLRRLVIGEDIVVIKK